MFATPSLETYSNHNYCKKETYRQTSIFLSVRATSNQSNIKHLVYTDNGFNLNDQDLKGILHFFLEIGSFYNSPRVKQLSFTVFKSIQPIF